MTPIRLIDEDPIDGKRLGRHVEHDPKSLEYPAAVAETLVTTLHHRHARIFDQGQLGSCTGNAMAGVIGTDPIYRGQGHEHANEKLAVELYEHATVIDGIPGEYPPDDTGSSGLAVAKAAQQLGFIQSYTHAFGLDHALGHLGLAPVIIGIAWFDSFDQPGPHGLLEISPDAQIRGGHEIEVLGLDVDAQTIRGANSWGPHWGDHGHFTMRWATFDDLLAQQGDVTCFA